MKRLKYFIIAISLLLVIAFQLPPDRYFRIAQSLDIYASVFKEVDRFYVDTIDLKKLNQTAIEAMLQSLDPYTTYIPEEEAEAFITSTTGEYAGIGAQISKLGDEVYITNLYEDFAAHRAGIKIGDQIVKINQQLIGNIDVSKISSLLKGSNKSLANISVLRNGDTIQFQVQREKITINNVPYFAMINNNTGYILLEDFTTNASKEVESALKQLKNQGANQLILDLRNNPGGLLSEAVNTVNLFIPKNKLVVSTKGKVKEWSRNYKTLNNPLDVGIPLVVLVNNGSASAAEIVAGVIQDYDRGILIGEQTFGKGLVQTSRPVSYNNRVKITTAKYYIPSGRCIQAEEYFGDTLPNDTIINTFKTKAGRIVQDKGGLMPDVVVKGKFTSPLVFTLLTEGYIFKFVNHWQGLDKKKLFPFDEFPKWAEAEDIQFSFVKDSLINAFEKSVLIEMPNGLSEVKEITAKIKKPLAIEIESNADQLSQLIQMEIASRTKLQKGRIETFLKYDDVVKKGLEVLENRIGYELILTKN